MGTDEQQTTDIAGLDEAQTAEAAAEQPAKKASLGDKIKKGDVLCVIESMKLMNDIVSDIDGEIIDICVNNEDVVEYSQTLFKIL